MPLLSPWYNANARQIAGVDEVGRGPLAGPVVAAAVVLDPEKPILGLDDSKKLSEKKREALDEIIRHSAIAVGVGLVAPTRIDQVNILNATFEAMGAAVLEIQRSAQVPLVGLLIDGNTTIPMMQALMQHAVVGGDAIWPCIMAASIIAKVYRDRLMVEAEKLYEGYGFAKHKGYGTREHLRALHKLGPCPIHRRSFTPVVQGSLWND